MTSISGGVHVMTLRRETGVFQACLGLSSGRLPALQAVSDEILADAEHQLFASFRFVKRQHSFLLGRHAAKRAVSQLTGATEVRQIAITNGVFGQPVVTCPRQPNIQVSIAHSESIGVALAFPEAHPMAIDVETVNSERHAAADLSDFLAEDRDGLLAIGGDPLVASLMLWSMREALGKVLKTGLTTDLSLLRPTACKTAMNHVECRFAHFSQYKSVAWTQDHLVLCIVMPWRSSFDVKALMKAFAWDGIT